MTNTELIRQEIERRIGAMYNFSSGYSALNVCRELLDFIDSLQQEEPVVLTPENRPDLFDENGHIDWGKLNPPPNVSTSPELNKIDLDEEITKYWKDISSIYGAVGKEITRFDFDDVCKYFYELGLNARKEE